MRSRSSWAVVVLGISIGRAQAQPADPAALSLYDKGRQLFKEGKFEQACPMFQASLRLDSDNLDTRGMLAWCFEEEGRLASAWSLFRDVKARALNAKRTREANAAEEHIAALGPQLAKITIRKPAAAVVVKKDGVLVSSESFGVPLAVDRGTHTFSAEAPGYQSWSEDRLIDDGQEQIIRIPGLDPAPAVPAVQQQIARPKQPESEFNPWRIAFYGSAAVALVGVGLWLYGYHEIDDAELGLCSGAHLNDCGHPPPTDPARTAQLDQEGNRGDNFSLAGKIATAVGGGVALLALYEGFFVKRGHDLAVVPMGVGAGLSGSW